MLNSLLREIPRSNALRVFALSLFFAPLSDIRFTTHISVCDGLLVFAAVMAVIEQLRSPQRLIIIPAYIVIAAIYFAILLANTSKDGTAYISTFGVLIIAHVVTPHLVSWMPANNTQHLRFLLLSWTAGGVYGAGFIVLFANGYFQSYVDPIWFYHHRTSGLTSHPNPAGLGCFLSLVGLMYAFWAFKSWGARMVCVSLILMTIKAIDYTASRSAFYAALVLISTSVLLHSFTLARLRQIKSRSLQILPLCIGMALAVITLLSTLGYEIPLVESVFERLSGNDKFANKSDIIRERIAETSFTGFYDAPFFGQGFAWSSFSRPDVAHNMYLQHLHFGGIFGFFALLIFLLYPLRYPANIFLHSRKSEDLNLLNALLSGYAAIAIWLIAQSSFVDYEAIILFALLAGISTRQLFGPINTNMQT